LRCTGKERAEDRGEHHEGSSPRPQTENATQHLAMKHLGCFLRDEMING
jgi:hypothetical protein